MMRGPHASWIARRLPAYVVAGIFFLLAFVSWFYPIDSSAPAYAGAYLSIEFIYGHQYARHLFYLANLRFIAGTTVLYFTTETPRFGLPTVLVANTVLAVGSLRTRFYLVSPEGVAVVSALLISLTVGLTEGQKYDDDTWTAVQVALDDVRPNRWLLLGKGAGYAVCAICLLFTVFILIPVEYPFSPQPSPTPGIAYLTATGSEYANAESTFRVAVILLVWATFVGYTVRFEHLKWLTASAAPIAITGLTIVHYDDYLTYTAFSTAVLLGICLLGIRLHNELLNDQ
jgi:hypothetical protein